MDCTIEKERCAVGSSKGNTESESVMRDFRLKLFYGREATDRLRRLYPQLSTRLLLRHGDGLLAHSTLSYGSYIGPLTNLLNERRQEFEEQHVLSYLWEYPQVAEPEAILKMIKDEQKRKRGWLVLDYPMTEEACLVRALGMRPFVDEEFRRNCHVRDSVRALIASVPYKAFRRSYRQFLDRTLYLLKETLNKNCLDDLINCQWYFETMMALVENALLYCPEVLREGRKEVFVRETGTCFVRALFKYNQNYQICDRLFISSLHCTNTFRALEQQ